MNFVLQETEIALAYFKTSLYYKMIKCISLKINATLKGNICVDKNEKARYIALLFLIILDGNVSCSSL